MAHAGEEERRTFLANLGEVRPDVELLQLEVAAELLAELLPHLEPFPVNFSGATFTQGANFLDATFTSGAFFGNATFTGTAYFMWATFSQRADFVGATFLGDATFLGATFTQDANFMWATFTRAASFERATFGKDLYLSTHVEHLSPAADHPGVADLTAAVFQGTARIKLGRPLKLADVVLQAPLTVVAEGDGAAIHSLEGATLEAPLVVGDGVDLGPCRLTGATGLDHLRIVATKPGWVYYRRRHVIADELCLRARMGDKKARSLATDNQIEVPDPACDRLPPEAITQEAGQTEATHRQQRRNRLRPEAITKEAGQTEATYRQLRAALETSKAAPAAADFYYGEMEMRRLATRRSQATSKIPFERVLLLVYKATCGYGLRAWRAFVTYAAILVAATTLFYYDHASLVEKKIAATSAVGDVNFNHWWEIFFKVVARTSVSFFSPIDTAGFHTAGVATLLALRFTGPTFLALAVLAIRAKVQR